MAFPFVKRLLSFNEIFAEEQPVEVVLLSRNSPETGLRVFRTIKHYGLDITRASFFSGESPYKYLPAFNASLFLSASERDVKRACAAGYAAGRVLDSEVLDDSTDNELRIAFDFDGVIADDESEKIYKEQGLQAGDNVTVRVAFNRVELHDYKEDGKLIGSVHFILYKGDHYHLTVKTENGDFIYVDTNDIWDNFDVVGISIDKRDIYISKRV